MVKLERLTPAGQKTGYSHAKCYMAHTNNCCSKISQEHLISSTIVTQMSERTIKAGGGFTVRQLEAIAKTSGLTARVLCRRHNSAISQLDDHAGRAFRAFLNAVSFFDEIGGPAAHTSFVISGDALELWAYKTLCCAYFSGMLKQVGASEMLSFALNVQRLTEALNQRHLSAPFGLYVRGAPKIALQEMIDLKILSDKPGSVIMGLRFYMSLFEFDVVMDTANAYEMSKSIQFYRPGALNLVRDDRSACIVLTWANHPRPQNVITYSI